MRIGDRRGGNTSSIMALMTECPAFSSYLVTAPRIFVINDNTSENLKNLVPVYYKRQVSRSALGSLLWWCEVTRIDLKPASFLIILSR